jgi:predicted Rossmann fold flavoprotein
MGQTRAVVAGGGAAGCFGAIACAEALPRAEIILLESGPRPLAKVRISGGGRCNVTNACFEPRKLVANYPRGSRELLGPLTRWGPRETVDWFARQGVALKAEADGRMFPITDDSQTVIDALMSAAERAGVKLRTRTALQVAEAASGGGFNLTLANGESLKCDALLLATGGGRGSVGHAVAASLGHTVTPLFPSLFTFKVADPRLAGLAGLAVESGAARVRSAKLEARGPILITHWGLSGPAILRLSAWGARELASRGYRFELEINWAGGASPEELLARLSATKLSAARKQVAGTALDGIPSRLWERLLIAADLRPETRWADVNRVQLRALVREAGSGLYAVEGVSQHKDEFVTCGGVALAEVDFRSMESRLARGLFLAGETLDIDGITGGFNFQSAWTTGRIAGESMAARLAAIP